MSNAVLAASVFGFLMFLIMMRLPIALSLFACGVVGVWLITGSGAPIFSSLKSLTYNTFASHSLSVIPLFLLMGQFATKGGLSAAIFRAANVFVGHRRGGLAMASVSACAAFGSICGSSIATASTMATVALPEMRKHDYAPGLAAGSLVAGGTLGALIPPSVVLILYAILAEQNIVTLFAASVVPGLLALLSYLIAVAIYVRLRPDSAKPALRVPLRERWPALTRVIPVVFIFGAMLGGIYSGIFTPTEGAAVGAALTGLYAWYRRELNWQRFCHCITDTAVSTAMIYLIVLAASVFNTFLAMTQVPQALSSAIAATSVSPWAIMVMIVLFYVVLGCIMDAIAMIMLTVPILLPVVLALDFGLTPEEAAIWFGIIVLSVVEIGMITPPLGMNLFVVQAKAPDISTTTLYRGVVPFICSDVVRLTVLITFPALSLLVIR